MLVNVKFKNTRICQVYLSSTILYGPFAVPKTDVVSKILEMCTDVYILRIRCGIQDIRCYYQTQSSNSDAKFHGDRMVEKSISLLRILHHLVTDRFDVSEIILTVG